MPDPGHHGKARVLRPAPHPGPAAAAAPGPQLIAFRLPFQGLELAGDHLVVDANAPTALLLHGGGSASAQGLQGLQRFLAQQGINSVAFDFIGHGRTGGALAGSTLRQRVEQAQAVLAAQQLAPAGLTLIGFSMGAYVAVKLAAETDAAGLGLVVPAAYAASAYELPFGPAFSQKLREPGSWMSSDAFDLARDFAGPLLVVSAENDAVIPAEIPRRYAAEHRAGAPAIHHVVAGAGHRLAEHYGNSPAARDGVYRALAALCWNALA